MTPPGLVVVACSELGRYTHFAASIGNTVAQFEENWALMWSIGSNVADNLNDGCRAMLENPEADWVWLLGDDHEWDPDLLPRMLARSYERDYDILVPLCFKRSWPPDFVIYDIQEAGVHRTIKPERVVEHLKAGRDTIKVLAAGNAGMLVRRRVLEAMDDPWFRNGILNGDGKPGSQSGEDINFCLAARLRGFDVFAALDLPFGHITTVTFSPDMVGNTFGMRLFFGTRHGPFYPLAEVAA